MAGRGRGQGRGVYLPLSTPFGVQGGGKDNSMNVVKNENDDLDILPRERSRSNDTRQISQNPSIKKTGSTKVPIVMDQNAKQVVDIENIRKRFLNCSICFEDFNDDQRHPRLLPCLHTYCYKCLAYMLKRRCSNIECPQCRELYPVTDNDITIFPKDNTRRDLLDFIASQKSSSTLLCEMREDNNPAKYRCKQCALFLCQDCNNFHGNAKCFKGHETFSIDEIECSPENVKEFSHLGLCQIEGHEEEKLKLYCAKKGCEMPICTSCVLTEHKNESEGHIIRNINEVYEKKRKLLQDEKQNVISKTEFVQTVIGLVEKEMNKVDDKCDHARESATAAFESCIQILQRRRDAVYENIESVRNQKQKILQDQKDNLTSLKETITDACDFLEQAFLYRNYPAFLEIAPSITSRLLKLKNTGIDELPHQRACMKFSLNRMGMEFQKYANDMGRFFTTFAYAPKSKITFPNPFRANTEVVIAIQFKDSNDLILNEENIDAHCEIQAANKKLNLSVPCKFQKDGYRATCNIENPGKYKIKIYAAGECLDERTCEVEPKGTASPSTDILNERKKDRDVLDSTKKDVYYDTRKETDISKILVEGESSKSNVESFSVTDNVSTSTKKKKRNLEQN